MFSRLMPRQGRFFDLFNEHAEQIVLVSRELAARGSFEEGLAARKAAVEDAMKRMTALGEQLSEQRRDAR